MGSIIGYRVLKRGVYYFTTTVDIFVSTAFYNFFPIAQKFPTGKRKIGVNSLRSAPTSHFQTVRAKTNTSATPKGDGEIVGCVRFIYVYI